MLSFQCIKITSLSKTQTKQWNLLHLVPFFKTLNGTHRNTENTNMSTQTHTHTHGVCWFMSVTHCLQPCLYSDRERGSQRRVAQPTPLIYHVNFSNSPCSPRWPDNPCRQLQTIHTDSGSNSSWGSARCVSGYDTPVNQKEIPRRAASDRNPAVVSTSALQLAAKLTHLACCCSPTDWPMLGCNFVWLPVGNYKHITVAALTANQRKGLQDGLATNTGARLLAATHLSKHGAVWSGLIQAVAQKQFLPQTEYHNLVLTSLRHIVCRTTPQIGSLMHNTVSACLI